MGNVRAYMMTFVRAMLALAIVGSYLNERWLVLFVSAAAFVVSFLPSLIHKRFGVKIPADFEIMIILFIYGSLFFGEVRGFYARFWWWDILLNFGAAIALGFVGLTILYVLYKDEQLDASPIIIAIFTFTFSFALGTLWEFFEFGMDYFFGFGLQKGSLMDTMKDLIVNSIGAFVVAVMGYVYLKEGKKNFISKMIVNFIEKNPLLFRSEKNADDRVDKILKLIKKGESEKVEFKSTLRMNIHTNLPDRKIEHSVLKTISALMNSEGGTLVIGVSDDGEVSGIEKDNFQSADKFVLHLSNLIKSQIGKEFFHYLHFEKIVIDGKTILRVDCRPSEKEVFLRSEQSEEFYIRNGPASVKLEGSSLLDYVGRRFRK